MFSSGYYDPNTNTRSYPARRKKLTSLRGESRQLNPDDEDDDVAIDDDQKNSKQLSKSTKTIKKGSTSTTKSSKTTPAKKTGDNNKKMASIAQTNTSKPVKASGPIHAAKQA